MVVAVIILVILVLLLIAPLKVLLEYENEKFKLNVFLYGIKVFSMKKKEKKTPKNPQGKAEKFEKDANKLAFKLLDIIELYRTAVRLLKKFVSLDAVNLKIRIGTGDAATTAISIGALWAAVYNILGIIGRIMYINSHKVEITPDYSDESFIADGKCIIKSRVVYIIIIAILILFKIKSLKGKEE